MKKQGETNVWKQAQIDLSPAGFRLFRNQRYVGPIVRQGEITNSFANCGLMNGAGDLIGYRIIRITPDMVGRTFAQFVSLESKVPKGGVVSEDQKNWKAAINKDGGLAEIIHGPEDYADLMP